MWIDGKPVGSGRRRRVEAPYDGSAVGDVFEAGPEEVRAAVEAAASAAKRMREMPLSERASILRKAHQLTAECREELAHTVSAESGKPIREARIEADRAAQTLLFSAEEAHRLCGEVVPADASPAGKGRWAMTIREPLGVIAAITPFNFPLNLAMHKIGPAIAAGNAVVHKPASATPIIALTMAKIFQESGLPDGALNVITGPGGAAGEMVVQDPGVAMITFTGSPEVGLRIRSQAGMKRVTLELGSNSAVIVAEDADLEEAAARCVMGAFANSGQVCISVQRIYVQERVAREFEERMAEGAKQLTIGHPHDPATEISSLITVQEAERVESWIAEAVQAGARLLTGGARRRATIEPTVLTCVPAGVKISCKEAFGPVVAINRYRTLDEAIGMVNDSDYGLQASIFTRDLKAAFHAAKEVHVGGFLINEAPAYRLDQMPYGGVKLSGTGREGPRYAIQEMTECKLILWR